MGTLYGILQGSDAEPLPRTVMLVHELVEEVEALAGAGRHEVEALLHGSDPRVARPHASQLSGNDS